MGRQTTSQQEMDLKAADLTLKLGSLTNACEILSETFDLALASGKNINQ